MEDVHQEDREVRPRRRLETKFEARTQKENESLGDYSDYFENYCSALQIEEEDMIKFFLAFLNTKSRRRAKMVKHRLQTWEDIQTILLRKGSREEQNIARRKLEQKTLQQGEDIMDFAASCLELAHMAWPDNEGNAEDFVRDYFVRGLPDNLAERAELKTNYNFMKLVEFVAEQSEKIYHREVLIRNHNLKNRPNNYSRPCYIKECTTICCNCGKPGHQSHQCPDHGYQIHIDSDDVRQFSYDCTYKADNESDLGMSSIPVIEHQHCHVLQDSSKTWDDMTEDDRYSITENIETSKLYISEKLRNDASFDGMIIRKLLLKQECQRAPQIVADAGYQGSDITPSYEYKYSVATSNRFHVLDELEQEITNTQYESSDQSQISSNKFRLKWPRNHQQRVKKLTHMRKSHLQSNNNSATSPAERRKNHNAACRRLEDKIQSMSFDEIVEYCTSRVLSPMVKRFVRDHHPNIFDLEWIQANRNRAAYLTYLCVSGCYQSKADALGYCLHLNIDTSDAVAYINDKFSTGWIKDLTRDGDVEPNPGPAHCCNFRAYSVIKETASSASSLIFVNYSAYSFFL